jgi:diacylglycerol kinase family enzyme
VLSLPKLYRGTHYSHPQVTHTVGSLVSATSIGDANARPIEIEADGEIAGALPATFGVLPGALALR